MSTEKTVVEEVRVEPIVVPVIKGTGDGSIKNGTIAETPGAQPNLIIQAIQPLTAIAIRFAHSYLVTLSGLVVAGAATDIIPAGDFLALVGKCATLSLAGAGIGLLKDLVTVFGRLENKYPLLTGSVCLLLFVGPGCAANLPPDTSPEARIAIQGDQVVQALRQTIPVIKQNVCQQTTPAGAVCLKPADAERVAEILVVTFTVAESLGSALQAVDEAKTAAAQSSGMVRVREIVRQLASTLTRITIVPGDEGARLLVASILLTVSSLLLAIGGL